MQRLKRRGSTYSTFTQRGHSHAQRLQDGILLLECPEADGGGVFLEAVSLYPDADASNVPRQGLDLPHLHLRHILGQEHLPGLGAVQLLGNPWGVFQRDEEDLVVSWRLSVGQ